jgi:hypothetical protein
LKRGPGGPLYLLVVISIICDIIALNGGVFMEFLFVSIGGPCLMFFVAAAIYSIYHGFIEKDFSIIKSKIYTALISISALSMVVYLIVT